MSYSCSVCLVNWWPHQIGHGQCPMCGARTASGSEPASEDADMLFQIVSAEADKRAAYGGAESLYAE